MIENFTEYLILFLIALLFAKDYLLAPILKKFGISTNGNGNYQAQIDILKEHANTSNREVGEINNQMIEMREDISAIRADLSFIRGKLDQ